MILTLSSRLDFTSFLIIKQWFSITHEIFLVTILTWHFDLGSLGIAVVNPRILGCERAYARSHPKMRPIPREILENNDLYAELDILNAREHNEVTDTWVNRRLSLS